MKTDYVFFWKVEEEHGYLSNWYMEDFYSYGIKYNCAEQWIMAAKAKLFNDEVAYEKIMKSNDPQEQKRFGRVVKNFNQSTWDHFVRNIAFMACLHKFRFSSELRPKLVNIIKDNKLIAESSPLDAIWGLGYDAKNAFANKEKWGTNYLGLALMEVGILLRDC